MNDRSPREMREHLRKLQEEQRRKATNTDRRQPQKSPAQVREELERYRGGRRK